jgi:hypothetical protein
VAFYGIPLAASCNGTIFHVPVNTKMRSVQSLIIELLLESIAHKAEIERYRTMTFCKPIFVVF